MASSRTVKHLQMKLKDLQRQCFGQDGGGQEPGSLGKVAPTTRSTAMVAPLVSAPHCSHGGLATHISLRPTAAGNSGNLEAVLRRENPRNSSYGEKEVRFPSAEPSNPGSLQAGRPFSLVSLPLTPDLWRGDGTQSFPVRPRIGYLPRSAPYLLEHAEVRAFPPAGCYFSRDRATDSPFSSQSKEYAWPFPSHSGVSIDPATMLSYHQYPVYLPQLPFQAPPYSHLDSSSSLHKQASLQPSQLSAFSPLRSTHPQPVETFETDASCNMTPPTRARDLKGPANGRKLKEAIGWKTSKLKAVADPSRDTLINEPVHPQGRERNGRKRFAAGSSFCREKETRQEKGQEACRAPPPGSEPLVSWKSSSGPSPGHDILSPHQTSQWDLWLLAPPSQTQGDPGHSVHLDRTRHTRGTEREMGHAPSSHLSSSMLTQRVHPFKREPVAVKHESQAPGTSQHHSQEEAHPHGSPSAQANLRDGPGRKNTEKCLPRRTKQGGAKKEDLGSHLREILREQLDSQRDLGLSPGGEKDSQRNGHRPLTRPPTGPEDVTPCYRACPPGRPRCVSDLPAPAVQWTPAPPSSLSDLMTICGPHLEQTSPESQHSARTVPSEKGEGSQRSAGMVPTEKGEGFQHSTGKVHVEKKERFQHSSGMVRVEKREGFQHSTGMVPTKKGERFQHSIAMVNIKKREGFQHSTGMVPTEKGERFQHSIAMVNIEKREGFQHSTGMVPTEKGERFQHSIAMVNIEKREGFQHSTGMVPTEKGKRFQHSIAMVNIEKGEGSQRSAGIVPTEKGEGFQHSTKTARAEKGEGSQRSAGIVPTEKGEGFQHSTKTARAEKGEGFQHSTKTVRAEKGEGFQRSAGIVPTEKGEGFQHSTKTARAEKGEGFQHSTKTARAEKGEGFQHSTKTVRAEKGEGFQRSAGIVPTEKGEGFQHSTKTARAEKGEGFQHSTKTVRAEKGEGFQHSTETVCVEKGEGFQEPNTCSALNLTSPGGLDLSSVGSTRHHDTNWTQCTEETDQTEITLHKSEKRGLPYQSEATVKGESSQKDYKARNSESPMYTSSVGAGVMKEKTQPIRKRKLSEISLSSPRTPCEKIKLAPVNPLSTENWHSEEPNPGHGLPEEPHLEQRDTRYPDHGKPFSGHGDPEEHHLEHKNTLYPDHGKPFSGHGDPEEHHLEHRDTLYPAQGKPFSGHCDPEEHHLEHRDTLYPDHGKPFSGHGDPEEHHLEHRNTLYPAQGKSTEGHGEEEKKFFFASLYLKPQIFSGSGGSLVESSQDPLLVLGDQKGGEDLSPGVSGWSAQRERESPERVAGRGTRWPGIQVILESYRDCVEETFLEERFLQEQLTLSEAKHQELRSMAQSLSAQLKELEASKDRLARENRSRGAELANLRRCLTFTL